MRTAYRVPVLFGSALVVAGFWGACDEGTVMQPDSGAISAGAAPQYSGVVGATRESLEPAANYPAEASVPVDVLA